MGRNQKSQRAKNNARPSNSGRSAELLEHSDINLLGFSSLKCDNVYLTQNGNIGNECNIPQDFQIAMKKMTKKDPTTRQKALQEFSHLCKTTDTEQVTVILRGWPRLYNILALDNDSRVREAAQNAHKALVCNVKRNIAPYLKDFIGTWFVSSFDNNSTVASVAKSSFQEVFPPTKRTEVIVFCQKEILNYIARNLIQETPESLSSNKTDDTAEVQCRYERIICSNLYGYSLFVEKLPEEHILKNKDEHMQKIINAAKFWKFANNESRMVRASWFSLLIMIMEKALYLFENKEKLCCTIFNHIDDPDHAVMPFVWEALNTCSFQISGWWDCICARGVSFVKLYKVLANACNESPAATMPCILHFLMRIQVPKSVNDTSFYSNILGNLISGLKIPKIQKSATDYEAITSCFFDYFHCILKKNYQHENLVHYIGIGYADALIRNSVYDPSLYGSSSTVFLYFSYLLRAWKKLAASKQVFNDLYEEVWLIVKELLIESFLDFKDSIMEKDDFEKRLRAHQKLINLLRNPHDVRAKKQMKVKFLSDYFKFVPEIKIDESIDAEVNKQLSVSVKEVLAVYYHLIDTVPEDYRYLLINQICNILNTFNDKSYFTHFIEITSLKPEAGENISTKLIDGLMKQWLSDNKVSVDAVLNVIFHLLIYLKDDEQVTVLTNISEEHMGNMLDLCLHLVDGQLQTSIRKWLNGSYFQNTLRSFAEDLTKTKPISQEKLKILKTSFKMSADKSCYAGTEAKLNVLVIIRNFLSGSNPGSGPKRKLSMDNTDNTDNTDNSDNSETISDSPVVSEADIKWIGEIMDEVYADVDFVEKYFDAVIFIIFDLFKLSCDLAFEQALKTGKSDGRLKFNDWEELHAKETAMYWYSISDSDKAWVRGIESLANRCGVRNIRFDTITYHLTAFVSDYLSRSYFPLACVYPLVRRVRLYVDVLSWKTYQKAGEVFGDIKREMTGVNSYRYITISGIEEYRKPELSSYCSICYMVMRDAIEAFMERAIEDLQADEQRNDISNACRKAEFCKGYFVYKPEYCCGQTEKNTINLDELTSIVTISSNFSSSEEDSLTSFSSSDSSNSTVTGSQRSTDSSNSNGMRSSIRNANNNRHLCFNADDKLRIEKCFTELPRLRNFLYYIACLLEMYSPCQLLDKPNVVTSNENCDALKHTEQTEIVKYRIGLERVTPVVAYELYLLAILRSVKQHFFHVNDYNIAVEKHIDAVQDHLKEMISKHEPRPLLAMKTEILHNALGEGVLWARALYIYEAEILNKESVKDKYSEIMVSTKRECIEYLVHVIEVFVPLLPFDRELYKPDGNIDQDKLTIVTHYLKTKRVGNFNAEQEHIIWYWLDALLIQKKQVEITYDVNLMKCRVSDIILATIICRFLSVVAHGKATLITKPRIDFIIVSLASWIRSIKKTFTSYAYEYHEPYAVPISIFICSVCDLLISISKVKLSPSEKKLQTDDNTSSDSLQQNLPGVESANNLYIDWNNLFAEESNTTIVTIWKYLADGPNRENVNQFLALNSMSNAVIHISESLEYDKAWLTCSSKMVTNPNMSVRFAAYIVFSALAPQFTKSDIADVENFEVRTSVENLPFAIYENLNEYLNGSKVGEVPSVKFGSVAFFHLHSYVLTWYMVISLCENADSYLRFHYATWLKEQNFLEPLLHNLAMLLPDKLLQASIGDITIKRLKDMFAVTPAFTKINADLVCNRLIHMIFHLYYRVLWILPSFVRQWWKSLDAKHAARIDRITSRFISQVLINEEIKAVKTIPQNDEKFSVRGYPTTRQIIATYVIEQVSVEITLTLATNHPLGITKVEGNDAVSIYKRFSNWVKQMNMFLSHQNGLIKDGLLSWKNNVDKAFEGIEECYICFSILHSSNYELPKKSCRTCHKKFHGMCLYRWLISSSKSTCPICRGVF